MDRNKRYATDEEAIGFAAAAVFDIQAVGISAPTREAFVAETVEANKEKIGGGSPRPAYVPVG